MAKVKIEELRLRNFRAFKNARFVLGDELTVLIGRNGSGKSTIMEAFDFVRDALTEGLSVALERRGGMGWLSHRPANLAHSSGFHVDDISLAIVLSIDGCHAVYGFRLGEQLEESISVEDGHYFHRLGPRIYTDVGGLAPVPTPASLIMPLIAGQDTTWNAVYDALYQCYAYSLLPRAIGSWQPIGGHSTLNRDGSNAADVLKYLETNGLDGSVDWIVERLGRVTPNVGAIHTHSEGGRRVIRFQQRANGDEGAPMEFDAAQMSDGTLRALGILLALRQKPTPTLVFIDEIEDSLHPEAISTLLGAAAVTTRHDFQAVVTSHNPQVLNDDAIRPEAVRVVEWHDGESFIYPISQRMIAYFKGGDDLGAMFGMDTFPTADEPALIGDADFFKLPAPNKHLYRKAETKKRQALRKANPAEEQQDAA